MRKTTTKKESQPNESIVIAPPNIKTVAFFIRGTAPLVIHKFSQKAILQIRQKQEAGSVANKGKKRDAKGENVTTWVCQECGCDIAEYGVCRCFDDEMEFFCAECAKENHEVELIVKNKKKPRVMGN